VAGKRLLIKVDAEGSEMPILRGAQTLLANDPPPAWILEIGLTENFVGQLNPDFRRIFEVFWTFGYRATCVEAMGRPVFESDVDAWIAERNRGFWNMNYLFEKLPARA